jgi:uncharacterized protein YkwD
MEVGMIRAIHRGRTRLAAVLLVSLSLLLSGFATDLARAGARQDRQVMLQLTNEARESKGRADLRLDKVMSRYAVKHSSDMADQGSLFHTADLAGVLKGRDWSMGGENVGVASSLTDLQAAFMASRDHRQNILQGGYDHAAIGVVESDGEFWVTVIFYG